MAIRVRKSRKQVSALERAKRSYALTMQSSVFNRSEWEPVSPLFSLEESLEMRKKGLSKRVKGTTGEVVEIEFDNGGTGKRILVSIKGQKDPEEFPVRSDSALEDGDTVELSEVYGCELAKIGRKNTTKFDVYTPEEVEEHNKEWEEKYAKEDEESDEDTEDDD